MNEIKLAQVIESDREAELASADIRLLDELELALAGGGDSIPGWP